MQDLEKVGQTLILYGYIKVDLTVITKWTRVVYFRKRNPDGTFMPNKGLANDKIVSEAEC